MVNMWGRRIYKSGGFCVFKMNKFKRFIPLTKIDKDKRMVFGFASTPDLDSDGEIVSLNALKNALPIYMEFPTIREMHQPKAAGTTKTAEIIKEGKRGEGLWISGKVVADDAWKLVKEGVYKGFSIGGNVIEKVENEITQLDLVEISLVDSPANRKARIQLWKKEFTAKDKKVLAIAEALAHTHKMQKDAHGTLTMANVLAHLVDVRFSFELAGKSTTKINRMIEQAKSIIATEASEKEDNPKKKERTLRVRQMAETLTKLHLMHTRSGVNNRYEEKN